MTTTPLCPYFGACGGCAAQDVAYDRQLARKRDALAKLFAIDEIAVFSAHDYGYRARVDMPFHPGGLGFRRRGRWDLIENVEHCAIAEDAVNRLIGEVRSSFPEPDAFDVRRRTGTLRYAVIRTTRLESCVTIILNPESPRLEDARRRIRAFADGSAADNVLIGYVPPNTDHSVTEHYEVLRGSAYLAEELLGLRFAYHSQGFFQANRTLTERMLSYSCERLARHAEGSGELVDLYGGVGSFGIVNGAAVGRVTVMEEHPRSVECAERNLAEHLGDPRYAPHRAVARPSEQLLSLDLQRPLYVITDPPRAGMHPRVLRALEHLRPDAVLYVSCNPERAADELAQLESYRLESLALFDLFPQTPHYEAVIELVAKNPLGTGLPESARFRTPRAGETRAFRVTTNPGIEADVTRELRELDELPAEDASAITTVEKPFALAGNVFCECSDDGVAARLRSALPRMRSIYHVVEHLHHFKLSDHRPLESIRDELESLPLPALAEARSFRITTNRSGDHPFASHDVQREVGAIVNRRYGTPVDLENFELELRVDVIEQYCLVGIQVTSEALDRRFPWRFRPRVTLRTPLAFAMLRRAGVQRADGGGRLLDPFCGSGTILIEAAALNSELQLHGGDWTHATVEGARDNLEACGYADRVSIRRANALEIHEQYPRGSFEYIVTNPPYGVRLGKNIEFEGFYRRFLSAAYEVLKPDGRLVILVGPRRSPFEAVLRELKTFELLESTVVESGGVYPSLMVLRARSQNELSRTKYSSPPRS